MKIQKVCQCQSFPSTSTFASLSYYHLGVCRLPSVFECMFRWRQIFTINKKKTGCLLPALTHILTHSLRFQSQLGEVISMMMMVVYLLVVISNAAKYKSHTQALCMRDGNNSHWSVDVCVVVCVWVCELTIAINNWKKL